MGRYYINNDGEPIDGLDKDALVNELEIIAEKRGVKLSGEELLDNLVNVDRELTAEEIDRLLDVTISDNEEFFVVGEGNHEFCDGLNEVKSTLERECKHRKIECVELGSIIEDNYLVNDTDEKIKLLKDISDHLGGLSLSHEDLSMDECQDKKEDILNQLDELEKALIKEYWQLKDERMKDPKIDPLFDIGDNLHMLKKGMEEYPCNPADYDLSNSVLYDKIEKFLEEDLDYYSEGGHTMVNHMQDMIEEEREKRINSVRQQLAQEERIEDVIKYLEEVDKIDKDIVIEKLKDLTVSNYIGDRTLKNKIVEANLEDSEYVTRMSWMERREGYIPLEANSLEGAIDEMNELDHGDAIEEISNNGTEKLKEINHHSVQLHGVEDSDEVLKSEFE